MAELCVFLVECRTKGFSCTKSAKQLHQQFIDQLATFEIDKKYHELLKEVMIYTYDSITKEVRENETNIKKQK